MNPELLGMSNEELIQWACIHGAIDEKDLRKVYDDIELFCAQNPIGVVTYIERLVDMYNVGYRGRKAMQLVEDLFV